MAEAWIGEERAVVEQALAEALPAETEFPQVLHRAMRYAVLGGGKRIRPLLCRAAAYGIAGEAVAAALVPACALEFIHAYSLIHDDLPALDDDDLRRGRPTCHRQFGDAMAILAGDALQTLAFGRLAAMPASLVGPMLAELSAAAGTPAGMVAGQVADLEATRQPAGAEEVERVHRFKTAALIRASVVLGGLAAAAPAASLAALRDFGENLGLAFQIVDDILDVTGTTPTLGKAAGKDARQAKATYPAVFGLEQSRPEAARLAAAAVEALAPLGPAADRLRMLATMMVDRDC